jgi:hypothetical protein
LRLRALCGLNIETPERRALTLIGDRLQRFLGSAPSLPGLLTLILGAAAPAAITSTKTQYRSEQ